MTTVDRQTELQRKIFTRWVNQKLELGKKEPIKDVVTGFNDGTSLVDLVSVLSEREWPGKPLKKTTMRMQQADQVSRALTWVLKDCGVSTKVPPCAENLMDGEERPVMGLVWAIMQKFLKFGDDEEGENLSAEDSLLMWVQNQLLTYPAIEVKSFTKSFHNGLAYAALIHKFRPNLIDPAQLGAGDALGNLAKVFEAAKVYFELEQYIEPADIAQLDSKSAFIFLSEFYYGIAKQRKVDLACRRITKLIHYTQKNDELRARYQEKANLFLDTLAKVTVELNDRTIDNTMLGAQTRLAAFQDYKAGDKLTIVDSFLSIESVYNHLSMRLADHDRPKYAPGAKKAVPELREALKVLEATELERQVALVQELNRQIRLKQLDEQHQTKYNHLNVWQTKNEALLKVKETIGSSGQAEYQINRLVTYNDESAMLQSSTKQEMRKLGAELVFEKFEFSAAVQEREATVQNAFDRMTALSLEKMETLKDDLARMKFKEATHLVNLKHKAKFTQIEAWVAEKESYLKTEETIDSISDATLQLSVLEMYSEEAFDVTEGSVASLKKVGQEILTAAYSSALSKWTFETPEEVTGREGQVDTKIEELNTLKAAKKATLDIALARELEKERLRLLFATQAAEFSRFTDSVVESAASSHFGFSLQEVEAYVEFMKSDEEATASSSANKQASFQQNHAEALSLGVTENVYTTLDLPQLAAMADQIVSSHTSRRSAYESELSRHRANDALCQKFAQLVDPFAAKVEADKDSITSNTGSLEEQLALVQSKQGENDSMKASVAEIAKVQAELDAAEVQNNPHTHYTAKDTTLLLQQYEAFLERKSEQLQEEIKHKALRGLTAEQHEEIEVQFKTFDKDSSGMLSKSEFKSCLYSLGEDKTSSQIAEVMEKYGSVLEGIAHKGFKEFMIEQLGDTDTSEEILNGFELINKGGPFALVERLQYTNLRQPEVDYILETAPKVEAGYDYKAWTADVFAR
jgi:hypothetical protein